jgi:uncharacterized protein YbjT (DUF2867 family)
MILVAGATGNLGSEIVRQLRAENKPVRALVRKTSDPAMVAQLRSLGATIVEGDLTDRASLDPVCRGIKTVITTANSAQRGGDDNPQTVDLEGNRNLVEAAAAAGVKQFLFVSAGLADANSPVPFVAAKGKTEQLLVAGKMPYTILAPNAFMDFWLGAIVGLPAVHGQPVTLAGTGRRKHTFIAARDVAAFALAAVDNPAALNRRLAPNGPEAVTYLEVVDIFGKVLGRTPEVRHVAPGDPIPGVPDSVLPLAASFDFFDSIVPGQELAAEFGVQLTTVEQFAHAMVAQIAALGRP